MDEYPVISVVVPLYNEESNVPELADRLFGVLGAVGETFEVLCVDDGSTDGTVEHLEAERRRHRELRIVRQGRNSGQHAAILAGFRASRGRWLITLDADLQNPPEEIPKLVEAFRRGHDLVGTYRVRRRDSTFRKVSSGVVNRVVRRVSGVPMRDFGCMLRGYSREVAIAMAAGAAAGKFLPALAYRYAKQPIEIPVSHAPRAAGQSKYGLRGLVRLALALVRSARR